MDQAPPGKLPEAVRQAAEDGDIETVNAWLNTEPDIHAQDDYGWSLIYAVVRGGGGAAHEFPRAVGRQRSHLEGAELLAAAAVVDGPNQAVAVSTSTGEYAPAPRHPGDS